MLTTAPLLSALPCGPLPAGAGVKGGCNPTNANYIKFFGALGSGSVQAELPRAAHTSFSELKVSPSVCSARKLPSQAPGT